MWTKMMSGPRKKAPKTIAVIDPDRCFGAFACSICQAACPVAGCIVEEPDRDGRMVCAVRADLLRQRVTPRLQFFRLRLHDLAVSFESVEALNVELVAARFQPRRDSGNVLTQQIDIEHGRMLLGGVQTT